MGVQCDVLVKLNLVVNLIGFTAAICRSIPTVKLVSCFDQSALVCDRCFVSCCIIVAAIRRKTAGIAVSVISQRNFFLVADNTIDMPISIIFLMLNNIPVDHFILCKTDSVPGALGIVEYMLMELFSQTQFYFLDSRHSMGGREILKDINICKIGEIRIGGSLN